MYRFAATVKVLLVAAVTSMVAGCQPSSPSPSTPMSPSASPPSASPSPVPTPTYLCTPEAGGDEAPCTQHQYDEMKAKDALYAEAEAVFKRFHEERVRISRGGGVREPTDIVLATTHGAARDAVMDSMRDMVERGTHAEGEDPAVHIARVPGVSKDGSLITLLVCLDATGWGFYKGDELVSKGTPAENRVYFSSIDDVLKMTYIEGRLVETCEQQG